MNTRLEYYVYLFQSGDSGLEFASECGHFIAAELLINAKVTAFWQLCPHLVVFV